MATAAVPRVFKNFINGEWVESRSGQAYENRNPANTDELVGMFVSSNAEDVNAAVDAAKEAYKSWRLVPAPKRAEILYRAAELLMQRKEELSNDMTREMGKVLAETRGDVQEAIDMTYYMAGRRPAAVWADDSFGVAEQVCDERAAVDRRVRDDYAVEFSDGDSFVEDDAGAGVRKYGGVEAGGGYAAVVLSPGADFDGSRFAARSGESGERRWARTRERPLAGTQGRAGGELHRFNGGGPDYRADVRAGLQALQPGNGREKHHHRDG